MTEEHQNAGFWLRVLALLIDLIVLAIPVVACESLIRSANPSAVDQDVIVVAELLKLAIWCVYFVTLHTIWGATIGKRALRIKVIDAAGNKPSFLQSLLRFIGFILSVLLVLVGFVMAAFTPRKRALHDYIARTEVIRSAREKSNDAKPEVSLIK